MRRVLWVGASAVAACVVALSVRGAHADDERGLAERILTLETEAKRLLAEVEALKGRLPQDAWARAELSERYRREVGEPIPADIREREAEGLSHQTRSSMDSAARRAIEAGSKRPLAVPLASPLVVLQVRSGAAGGNPSQVDMLGRLSAYVARRSREPLPWNPVVGMRETSSAYALGGTIPQGKAFAVTKVTWRAVAAGDSNGHGEYVVRLGGETITRDHDSASTSEGSWTGRVLLRHGDESEVQIEVANSSALEARFEGELLDDPK